MYVLYLSGKFIFLIKTHVMLNKGVPIQTFEIDLNITTLSNVSKQVFNQIGECVNIQSLSNDSIVINGKTQYLMQAVNITVQLDKIDEANTKLSIQGTSEDVWGVSVKKGIEKFMNELSTMLATINNVTELVKTNETNSNTVTAAKYIPTEKKSSTNKFAGFIAIAVLFFIVKGCFFGNNHRGNCIYCDGRGVKDCIYCVNGTTNYGYCTFCNGKGKVSCTFCNGTGNR